jgi:hypothetical protein
MAKVVFLETDAIEIKFAGELFQIPAGKHRAEDLEKLFAEKLAAHGVTGKDLIDHADKHSLVVPVDSSGRQREDKSPAKRLVVDYDKAEKKVVKEKAKE